MAEVAQEVPGPAGSEVTRPNILFVMVGVIWCCLSLSGLYPSGWQQWVFHQAGSDFSHGGGKFLIKCSLKQWLMLYFSKHDNQNEQISPWRLPRSKTLANGCGTSTLQKKERRSFLTCPGLVFWENVYLCFDYEHHRTPIIFIQCKLMMIWDKLITWDWRPLKRSSTCPVSASMCRVSRRCGLSRWQQWGGSTCTLLPFPLLRQQNMEKLDGGLLHTSSSFTYHHFWIEALSPIVKRWRWSLRSQWSPTRPCIPSSPLALATSMARTRPLSCCPLWHCSLIWFLF